MLRYVIADALPLRHTPPATLRRRYAFRCYIAGDEHYAAAAADVIATLLPLALPIAIGYEIRCR